jgi:hypothetical protein
VTVDIQQVTKPAEFSRLSDALDALTQSLALLPLMPADRAEIARMLGDEEWIADQLARFGEASTLVWVTHIDALRVRIRASDTPRRQEPGVPATPPRTQTAGTP